VCDAIAKNRKMLGESFAKRENNGIVKYNDSVDILNMIMGHLDLGGEKMQHLLKCGIVQPGQVDYKRVLKVYAERSMTDKQHPNGQPI
jgi:hypothetical protein